LNYFISLPDISPDKEIVKLLIAIINSFVISKSGYKIAHSIDVKLVINNTYSLTQTTIKLIFSSDLRDILMIESLLKLLKSLALNNLFSVENCFSVSLKLHVE